MKIVIGLKTGKSFQKEIEKTDAESLYGRVLGETIKGDLIGFSGAEFTIQGGSDYTGIPMRPDLTGTKRRKILTKKSLGFRGKLRKKTFAGLRIKKTMAGNTVFEKTHQLNLKCIKGEKIVEDSFKPKVEEKTE
jgi:small subunit ribosomal protein S6e